MSFLWGNTANQQPDPKKFANISNDQINSNQQSVPVKYLAGRNYVAGDYISPAYNPKAVPIKTKSGKSESSTSGYKYFADFALLFCTGGRRPVDAIYKVIVDSDIRWDGNVTRGNALSETIQVDDLGTIKLYWGGETQGIDGTLLTPRTPSLALNKRQDKTEFPPNHKSGETQFGGFDAGDSDPYAGHYDKHPAYKGQCYAVFKNWKLGRDRTSVPNIQFELMRGSPWVNGTSVTSDARGVNPIAVLYDWLTDTRFGMALPDSMLNTATFSTAYAALETLGVRISPLITSQTDFRSAIADLLSYFDGWIRRNGSLIEVGVWATGTVPPGPTLTDDDCLGEPELVPQGFGPTFNEITVTYKDKDHHFNDYVQVYRDPNNFRITGGPRPTTLSRPWFTDAATAKGYARMSGAAMAMPFTKGDLHVKREWLTTNSMVAGKVFTYNSVFYGPSPGLGLSFLMRLLEVAYPKDDSAEATLTVEWERSKWPSIFVPQPFQGPGGFVLGPRAIWQSKITEVPYLLLDQKFDTQVVILATRGNVEVQGYRIWFTLDPDPNPVYQLVPDDSSTSSFASYGRLTALMSATNGRADFNLFGIDLDEVVSQTPAEQQDDNLLLFVGGEVMSVGRVNPEGHGAFNCQVLRGRFGTLKVSHSANIPIFFLYRSRLKLIDNAGFTPGAVVRFKFQPFTADLDYDITTLTPISYTIVGFADVDAPVLSPAPNTFTTHVDVSVSPPPAGFKARFTRDGTAVKATSVEWPKSGGNYITTLINNTKTIRVRFFNPDTGRTSPETQGTYTKVATQPPGNANQCALPTWTYTGVLMHSPGNLVLTATTPGSTIHYKKTNNGVTAAEVTGGGPLTVALACNLAGDQLEYWASFGGYDDSAHHVIDNTKETTFGGGGHWPPRNPV
jgi:hypothetical protein